LIGELFAEGNIGDYVRAESEFAVMSQCAGAAFGGIRVFTSTAGPGTMRAMENFLCGPAPSLLGEADRDRAERHAAEAE
jgi:pyruvate/2-oxoacid:ferredoxin oxidoreductase alpha subunit